MDPALYLEGHPTTSRLSWGSPKFTIPCQNQGGLISTSKSSSLHLHIGIVIDKVNDEAWKKNEPPGCSTEVYLSSLVIQGDGVPPSLPTRVCVWAENPFTLMLGFK